MSFYSILKWEPIPFSIILSHIEVIRHSNVITKQNANNSEIVGKLYDSDPGYFEDHTISDLDYEPFYAIRYVGHNESYFTVSNTFKLSYVLYGDQEEKIRAGIPNTIHYHSFGKYKNQNIRNMFRLSDVPSIQTNKSTMQLDNTGKGKWDIAITGPENLFGMSGTRFWRIGDHISRNDFRTHQSILSTEEPIIYPTTATINRDVQDPSSDSDLLGIFSDNVIEETNMTVDNGIISMTFPYPIDCEIEVAGAAGGRQGSSRSGYVPLRAEGAIVRATFLIPANSNMKILIGQMGHDSSSSSAGASGGTFVVLDDEPLIIAGGGGGGGYRQDSNRGQLDTRGGVASGGSAHGGRDGNGGEHGGSQAAGGGGFLTDGDGNSSQAGKAFVNGGRGGSGTSSSRAGGFGGGAGNGGRGIGGPGGGGYSGGASGSTTGSYSSIQTGGGGGSFIHESATNVYTSNGQWTTHGTEPHSVYTGSVKSLDKYNDDQGYIRLHFI